MQVRRRARRAARVLLCLVTVVVLLASCRPAPRPFVHGRVFHGYTFDACTAPSVDTMQRWLASRFRAVGIYIGGANRACSQPQLSAQWVAAVRRQHWKLLPLYVGLQAPCTTATRVAVLDPSHAGRDGRDAATDAVRKAKLLGMGQGTPIYFDMEAYGRSGLCIVAVRSFVNGWVNQLHALGYVAGYYSSSASGMKDLDQVYSDTRFAMPDHIWFANWDGRQKTFGDPYIHDANWANHQRHHQYRGGHDATYGGVTINIDSSKSYGAVAG